MTLWIVLALMTVVAALIVAMPMMRTRKAAMTRDSFSLEVYREQLQELDGDSKRGLLSEDEVGAARLEIERRMLALSTDNVTTDAPKTAAAQSLPVVAMVALAMAGLSFLLYSELGTPGVPDQPFAQRTPPPDNNPPGEMREVIERLAKRLENEPDNLEGWSLLGQSYSSVADYDNAANAFQQALKLAPDDTDLLMSYGESMVLGSGNQVVPVAREAFEKALKIDPGHMGSQYYLAEYQFQTGNVKQAMDGWLQMVANSPADAPWMPALMQRLERAAKEIGIELSSVLPKPLPATGNAAAQQQPESGAAPGPTQADVAAAGDMSAEDRTNMIRSMVERLADKLKEDPDNFEGWQRLARAYAVLGEKEKAAAAYERMSKLQPGNVDLMMQQASRIIETTDRSQPLPDEAARIFSQVLAIQPENQDALYFTGLIASQRQQFDVARANWKKLLALLPKDGQAWQAVNTQLLKLPAGQ
jgi:cytochrome c-type biogenesis protein CcmH